MDLEKLKKCVCKCRIQKLIIVAHDVLYGCMYF